MLLTKQRVSMAISLSKIHRHMQISPQRANERRKFHTNVTWSLELLQEVLFGEVQTPRKRRRDNVKSEAIRAAFIQGLPFFGHKTLMSLV